VSERRNDCAGCGRPKDDPSAFTQRGFYADGSPRYLSLCNACRAEYDKTPERREASRKRKEATRRAQGIPRRGEKPACSKGHPYPESKRPGRSSCAVCHREQELARKRAAGVEPWQPAQWTCSHDPESDTRYVTGKSKGCRRCHAERQRERHDYDPERVKAYAQAHRPEINARVRAWRAVNRPDVVEFRNGDALAIEYAAIIDGDPCSYCGGPAGEKDHIIPVSRGGTGDWDNLAAACRKCNASKQTKDVMQFMLARLALAA
jgi:hypothetical protein